MPQLEPLLQGPRDPENGTVDPLGVTLVRTPQRSRVYAQEYVSLLDHIESLAPNMSIRFKSGPYY